VSDLRLMFKQVLQICALILAINFLAGDEILTSIIGAACIVGFVLSLYDR
jgi:hypothetical protein